MRRIAIVAGLVFLMGVVIGCEGSSQSSVSDLVKKWNDNSLTTIMHAVFGTSTGNAGQDGVIDSAKNITDQDDADKAALSAFTGGDAAALDALVNKFPADSHFRNLRGTLAIQQGDTGEFVRDFSFSVPGESGRIGPITDKIEQLAQIAPKLQGQFVSANQCDEYYGTLSQLYRQRFELSQKQADLDQAAQYDATHTATCGALPR